MVASQLLFFCSKPMVDVSNLESSSGGPELTVAALPKTGEIVLLEMSQRFHVDHLEKVMDAALKGCTDIYNILDKVVRKHVEKSPTLAGSPGPPSLHNS